MSQILNVVSTARTDASKFWSTKFLNVLDLLFSVCKCKIMFSSYCHSFYQTFRIPLCCDKLRNLIISIIVSLSASYVRCVLAVLDLFHIKRRTWRRSWRKKATGFFKQNVVNVWGHLPFDKSWSCRSRTGSFVLMYGLVVNGLLFLCSRNSTSITSFISPSKW